MKKKILSLLLAMSLTILSVCPVMAETITAPGTSAGTTVSFTKAASWTVTIPSTIALTKGTTNWENTSSAISANGAIESNKTIKVTSPATVALTTAEGGSIAANVTFGTSGVKSFTATEVLANTSSALSVATSGDTMPAGSWTGTLTFTIAKV